MGTLLYMLYGHGWETAGCSRHAGQSDWLEKNCVVLLPKKRRRPVSCRHEFWPSDVRYFLFALIKYSMTPTLTYFRPRWNLAANQRAQHCAGRGRRQSVNEYSGWRHTMARSYCIAVGLLVMYGNYYFYRWGNYSVSWAFGLCFMTSLTFKKV